MGVAKRLVLPSIPLRKRTREHDNGRIGTAMHSQKHKAFRAIARPWAVRELPRNHNPRGEPVSKRRVQPFFARASVGG